MPDPERAIPAGFDQILARVLVPGEEVAAARVLIEAADGLDDLQLASFLAAFAALVRDQPGPISAAELRGLLDSCRPG